MIAEVGNMKLRIAIWALVGVVVVGLWSLYFTTVHVQPQGSVALFLDMTCPVAVARQHPMSIYITLFANALTYALFGLVIESLRRPMKRPLNA
jgi:hypothetical protein